MNITVDLLFAGLKKYLKFIIYSECISTYWSSCAKPRLSLCLALTFSRPIWIKKISIMTPKLSKLINKSLIKLMPISTRRFDYPLSTVQYCIFLIKSEELISKKFISQILKSRFYFYWSWVLLEIRIKI